MVCAFLAVMRRIKRHRLERLSPIANAYAVGEVAIGEIHAQNGAAETLTISPVEIKAWLDRDAIERSADGLAFDLKCSRRQPCRTD